MIALLLSFLLLVATVAPTEHTSTFASDFIPAVGAEVINDNCVWSPVSVENVLALLYFGANHETAAELKSVLKSHGTKRDLAVKIGSIPHEQRQDLPLLHIGDNLYFDRRLLLKKGYLELAIEISKGQLQMLYFEKYPNKEEEINSWLRAASGHKIEMITESNTNWNAGAVVVNQIYFKAQWANPFPKHRTYEVGEETREKYEMMVKDNIMLYAVLKDLDAYAAVLKFQRTNVSMLVLLPKRRENGLADLEEKLKEVDLTQLPKAMKDTHVTLMMPKFKVEFDTPLKPTLEQLGLNNLFSHADFSELLEGDTNLVITEIRHKSYIEVTEDGIEAASCTGVGVHPPAGTHNDRNNRQFFFALIDEENVYFAGHIANI